MPTRVVADFGLLDTRRRNKVIIMTFPSFTLKTFACFTLYSHTLGSASRVLRLRLGFAHQVGDYPGSPLLANARDLGGTNRIFSQGQFSLEKVGDYPGSRRLLKVQINNHRIVHFVHTITYIRDYLF